MTPPSRIISVALSLAVGSHAFTSSIPSIISCTSRTSTSTSSIAATPTQSSVGNLHGQGSCFLPLLQNDDEYIAPRIVQIAGAYPGVTTETYLSITSEQAAVLGQWAYDFSDPNGPQLGTVAIPGSTSVYETEDPVVLIAEHFDLGVQLPDAIKDPVDLVVLVDRARQYFAERKFLVMELEENPGMISIGAFSSKEEMPSTAKIMGQVMLVQIPWLPSMQRKKSGFMEEDQLF
mmetsp:Transcript_24195/g.37939  ORF Transcript_24195/g.37939 Transcript_24195/m.37939 type:complete len:233 (-) Transcript_24195:212-910(-)|eukprot:CAMPEP_0201714720 /NCGR_PEP_ID=MMETSP0593-20130828/1079_1 /ASSEMBLY_ACC=CAM_ASM_000672 /TAXON_ID=267983 /ORGANISM="Skeletonema japonicum, Strain CCMP2506" /LENGTH=232 /DNA_ID=CAMNT_0048204023 /DNA_START=102 /DNA_END=800 /DNA_ORIENTATION=+